jgi:hypothetical protein
MQDTGCKIQDKSPQPPFTKERRGGITKKSSIMHYASCVSVTSVVSLLQLALLVLLLLSCGKKEVKPVSPESKITQEAVGLAETIRNAYINNDRKTLERNFTNDGYRELIGAIKSFDSAELTFIPTWVEIEDSVVSVNVSWKGTWIAGGKRTEDRGLAVFVLEGRPLKLSQVLRANPFRQPE